MKRLLISIPVALLALCVMANGEETMSPGGKKLAPGDDAPRFSLPGSDGATHSLEDHLGKRAVVIAWFPKAFTGG